MKKQVSVLLIAAAVLTAVFVAGCTSQTASPTPSPSTAASTATGTATPAPASIKPIAPTALPNSTNLSSFFTGYMQSQGYTVTTPFIQTLTNQYRGSISDGKYVYDTVIQVATSPANTTYAFNSLIGMLQRQGYVTQQTNSTTWIGYNSNNGYPAYISQDTTDNFVVGRAATSIGSS